MAKSSEFKSVAYDTQSAGVHNSTNSHWVVLVVWAGAESAERHIFGHDTLSGPGDLMLSQKLLVDVDVEIFTQPAFISLNPQDLLLIPPRPFLSPPLSSWQVHTVI
jgi:hypothetical protein